MTEEHPGAERRADDARRAALMFATLGFAALPRIPADMAPVFQGLHRWLDSWRGIGDLVTGMNRQAYDLELTQYPDGWRCTFFVIGREHSLTPITGSAWEKTPWCCPAGRGTRARADDLPHMIAWPSAAEVDAWLVVLTIAAGIWFFWSVRRK